MRTANVGIAVADYLVVPNATCVLLFHYFQGIRVGGPPACWPFPLCLETGNKGDPVREVSKGFGEELRRRRLVLGLSLHDLSVAIHYSRGHISKVENNKVAPSAQLVRLTDAALNAEGKLLAFAAARPYAAQDTELSAWTLVPGGWSPPGGSPGAACGVLSSISPAQAEAVVEAFRDMFDQLRAMCRAMDGRLLLPVLSAHAHALCETAAVAHTATCDAAFVLAGRYAELAGWVAQEAGDDQAALSWTELACRLAEAGGDGTMGAYADVRRALIALYRGDALGTIGLARKAQAYDGMPARVRGLALLREAQGYALAGNTAACHRSLDLAGESWAQDAPAGSGWPVLGPSALADPVSMTTAWCLYDLGKAADSAAAFDVQIARIPAEARRTRTRFSVRRALAYAMAGEVDHSCTLTRKLLPDIRDLASATIGHDLRQLARAFRRWHTHRPVRDLQPQVEQLLRVQE